MPAAQQNKVYDTVRRRGPNIDSTWAPWWRAQAEAIASVLRENLPEFDVGPWLEKAHDFARKLEEGKR